MGWLIWSLRTESNRRPLPYQGSALPTELRRHKRTLSRVPVPSQAPRQTTLRPESPHTVPHPTLPGQADFARGEWSLRTESNRRPLPYQGSALPTELRRRKTPHTIPHRPHQGKRNPRGGAFAREYGCPEARLKRELSPPQTAHGLPPSQRRGDRSAEGEAPPLSAQDERRGVISPCAPTCCRSARTSRAAREAQPTRPPPTKPPTQEASAADARRLGRRVSERQRLTLGASAADARWISRHLSER